MIVLNTDGSTSVGTYRYQGSGKDVIRNSCPWSKDGRPVLVKECLACVSNKVGMDNAGKMHYICVAEPALSPALIQNPEIADELIDSFTWHRELSDDDKEQERLKTF